MKNKLEGTLLCQINKSHTYGRVTIFCMFLVLTLSGCTYLQKRELEAFEVRWKPLQDSVNSYLDSINYLPRQATTYLNMMNQDTLFFRLFDPKSVERLIFVRQEVETANQIFYKKEAHYREILRKSEMTDLVYQQTKRYLNGVYPKPPRLSIKELGLNADTIHQDLKELMSDHKLLSKQIKTNFFMHKDLHNNLMRPFWDSLYQQQPEAKPLSTLRSKK
jgi:hypothetical protein